MKNLLILALMAAAAISVIGCASEPGPAAPPPDAQTKTAEDVAKETGGMSRRRGEGGDSVGRGGG